MVRHIFGLVLAVLLVGCDTSSSSGGGIDGEPLPRAVTIFASGGNNAVCTQYELQGIPNSYGAKYIHKRKTFNTTLTEYQTCRDVSVEDYVADVVAHYEHSEDYYDETARVYEYGGVQVGTEETRQRSYRQGNRITHGYVEDSVNRDLVWTFEKRPDSEGLTVEFDYQSYGQDGRKMNSISSQSAYYETLEDEQRLLRIPFTVNQRGWANEKDFIIINQLILQPEELNDGQYELLAYINPWGEVESGALNQDGETLLCYDREFNNMYVYRADGWGGCQQNYYDEPIAVVGY